MIHVVAADGKWAVMAGPDGDQQVSVHKTKKAATAEAQAMLASEPHVEKASDKCWTIVVAGDVVGSFPTKKAADAELVASLATIKAVGAGLAATKPAAEVTRESDFNAWCAALAPADRINECRPERDALAAWRAAGTGDRPETPIIDWMSDPSTKPARKSRSESTPSRDDDQEATMTRIITEGRSAGTSFPVIAQALNDAGVPTVRGVPWSASSTWTKAKRLGLID